MKYVVKKYVSLLMVFVLVLSTITIGSGPSKAWADSVGVKDIFYGTSGNETTIVIKEDGSLWQWGTGTFDSRTPSYQFSNVKYAYTNGYNQFVIKEDGTLLGRGNNDFGQIGDGTKSAALNYKEIMTNVKQVKVVGGTVYAIKEDGTLWAWGRNQFGQVGNGSVSERLTPIQIMTNVKYVTSSGYTSFAIKEDGTLWGWGFNSNGELGLGVKNDYYTTPRQITSGVKYVVNNGGGNTYALKENGTLWAWGYNYYGSVGDGTKTDRLTPVQIMTNVKFIASYKSSAFAIKENGTLWAWGKNHVGQLGDGSKVDRATPVQIMTNVKYVTTDTYSDYHSSFAIKEDGSLWGWGSNNRCQLGISGSEYTTPQQIMSNVKYVVLANHTTFAIKENGTLWGWGDNYRGQLGNNKFNGYQYPPIQIMLVDILSPATFAADITTPTNSVVTITINYPTNATIKEYKIDSGAWTEYTGPIVMNQNGTVYARSKNAAGTISEESSYVVSNIYKVPPVISLTPSTNEPTNQDVVITVSVTDSGSGIVTKKYASGNQTANYFASAGTILSGNSFIISANGTYSVYAKDNAGNETVEIITISNIDKTPPADATFSANPATPTNGNVTITINYPSDAAVKEYKIGTGTWTTYIAPIVVTENTTVFARSKDTVGNMSGESSYEVKNIDRTPPDAPTLSASPTTPTNGNVTVTITFSDDSVVKEYKIGSGLWTDYTEPVIVTENNTVYARGKDSAGNYSAESSLVISNIDKIPLKPSLTLSANETSVVASWTNINNATEYELKRDGVTIYTGSDLQYTDTNLYPNTSYTYSIVAKNSYGSSEADVKTVKTLLPIPAKPNLNATPTYNSVSLSWEPVQYAESYIVKRGSTKIYEGSNLSYEDTGLSPETKYYYSISAKNSSGESEETQIEVTTKVGPPAKPTIFTVAKSSSITINWNTVAGATEYIIRRNGDEVYRGNDRSFVDSGLQAEKLYSYEVIARNESGEGITTLDIFTVPVTPVEIEHVIVDGLENDKAVEFTFNTVDGVVKYIIKRNPEWTYTLVGPDTYSVHYKNSVTGEEKDLGLITAIDGKITHREEGLEPNTLYQYNIISEDDAGNKSRATTVSATTLPSTPDNLKISEVTQNSITLTWDGQSGVNFIVKRNGTQVYNGTKNSFKDTNLEPDQTYTYEVIAENVSGLSLPSSITAKTLSAASETISRVDATVIGNTVTLTWNDVSNTYGYYVHRYNGDKRELNKSTKENQFVDTDVLPGNYRYEVIVYNKNRGLLDPVGVDVTVQSNSGTPDNGEPGNGNGDPGVTDLHIRVEGNKVILDWTPSSDPNYGYYVQRFNGANRELNVSTKEAYYEDQNVKAGDYRYEVQVYKKVGGIQPYASGIVSVTNNPGEIPSYNVKNVVATLNGKMVQITWDGLDDVYGFYLYKYKDGKKISSISTKESRYSEELKESGEFYFEVAAYHKNLGVLPKVRSNSISFNGGSDNKDNIDLNVDFEYADGSVTISWNSVQDIYGYYVYKYQGDKRLFSKTTKTNQFVDTNVTPGTYRYEIVVYRVKGGLTQPFSIEVIIPEA
jgi:alpha-tubulin suppressor-like RCC1 family protein/fibronectin type 3 domain-containing protein